MFKFSNETKIGILALVAIGLAYWGFQFLKGINVLSRSQTFLVRYENADQLRPSSPVFVKGLQVGMVKDMYVDPANDSTIIVVLDVESRVDVPKNTEAVIISLGLMGGKAVELVIKQPCNGADCAESGTYLNGRTKNFMQTLIGDPTSLDAYTSRLREGLTINVDSLAKAHPDGMASSVLALEKSLKNLEIITQSLGVLMSSSTSSLNRTLDNAASITNTVRQNSASIDSAIANLTTLSKQLKNAGLDNTAKQATAAIDSVKMTLYTLKGTLQSTTAAIRKVESLATGMSAGQGTVGKLLTDTEMYNNLNKSLAELEATMLDLRLNPGRYISLRRNSKRDRSIEEDEAEQELIRRVRAAIEAEKQQNKQ